MGDANNGFNFTAKELEEMEQLHQQMSAQGLPPILDVPQHDDEEADGRLSIISISDESYIQDLINQRETRENDRKEEALEDAMALYQIAIRDQGLPESEELFLQIFHEVLREMEQKAIEKDRLQDERLAQVIEKKMAEEEEKKRGVMRTKSNDTARSGDTERKSNVTEKNINVLKAKQEIEALAESDEDDSDEQESGEESDEEDSEEEEEDEEEEEEEDEEEEEEEKAVAVRDIEQGKRNKKQVVDTFRDEEVDDDELTFTFGFTETQRAGLVPGRDNRRQRRQDDFDVEQSLRERKPMIEAREADIIHRQRRLLMMRLCLVCLILVLGGGGYAVYYFLWDKITPSKAAAVPAPSQRPSRLPSASPVATTSAPSATFAPSASPSHHPPIQNFVNTTYSILIPENSLANAHSAAFVQDLILSMDILAPEILVELNSSIRATVELPTKIDGLSGIGRYQQNKKLLHLPFLTPLFFSVCFFQHALALFL